MELRASNELDEPTNHLDIPSRARFEEALASFKGTILTIVHDRYFIERFASEVWIGKNGRIEKHYDRTDQKVKLYL